jgi:ribosome biogenesis ATPase
MMGIVFARARASAPCVIFFDELDALCPRRGGGSDSQTSERVVNQLLTELDGLESRKNVYVIAATNRPDVVDRAILRPGRFDKLLHVRLPTAAERLDILRTLTKRLLLSGDVELRQLAQDKRCDRFSGADLSSLIREAGMAALKETLANNFAAGDADACKTDASIEISRRHFNQAFSKCQPSVTEQDLRSYESMEKRLGLSATDA